MDSTVIVLVIVVVVLLLALVAVGMVLAQRRRSERLQEQFGPEYERSVDEAGSRRAAEAQLAEREKRHRKLDIRDLRPEERERFAASWADIQREFVDDPHRAVRDADLLVLDIMRTRGYPVGDDGGDFERRAEDISVEHPDVVQRYREAHRVRTATERGDVDTENQREAVTSYRSLVDALLGTRGHDGATHDGGAPTAGTHADTRANDARAHDARAHDGAHQPAHDPAHDRGDYDGGAYDRGAYDRGAQNGTYGGGADHREPNQPPSKEWTR
ncbi:MAG TPA: hypothetical protein VKZ81_18290 [Pseudonocardia sp.]|uniref:hypothetical protein n=1 Tax=Pseudonocardia sp. TaxID=60912 RepID=UPI002B4B8AD3|nr:hypothetical protein [Pseudonocardia sp.]HLU57410.1 hypothetical protein [Pseudonocardia sp.]